MKDTAQLYFIALVPPEPVFGQVENLKHEVKERFGSGAALKSPPHITLHMPFKWPEVKEEKVIQSLEREAANWFPVPVTQEGFRSFPPKVIFVQVTLTEALLQLQRAIARVMKRELNIFNADHKNRPFHPHMTIAFRDLKKSQYQAAWQYYQEQSFSAEWIADKVAILKHDGKMWQLYYEITLAAQA